MNAHTPVDSDTTSNPPRYTHCSPSRCTSSPVGGAKHSRITEKMVIANVTAPILTPNVRAKAGNTGDTTPYPSAATAFAPIKTHASRGSLVDFRPRPLNRERRVARVTQ